MSVFSLLAAPDAYQPCAIDMHEDAEYREHWLGHFEKHFDTVARLAIEQYGPEAAPRVQACKADLVRVLHDMRDHPQKWQPLHLLVVDYIRQEKLLEHGLPDPFEKTKARENEACLAVYPRVVAELDSHHDPREALLLAVEGVFAGNIFDLGAGATTSMFADKSPDFLSVRDGLRRPWLVDHFDALAAALLRQDGTSSYAQALFFCDNAGSDFVLGVLPFCRWLAQRGTRVVIGANRLPALNDMTIQEVRTLMPRFRKIDPVLDRLIRTDRLAMIDSGDTVPLFDLREVSVEVNVEAPRTDLVILEGMGRGLETNYAAQFTCDSLKLAMIKDKIVAKRHGGKNFDTVCRFDRGTTPSSLRDSL
jgi:type II pantothenate kinase